jgi:4-hydroxyphenylpyruvate dioxygenase-like putative hemolysin
MYADDGSSLSPTGEPTGEVYHLAPEIFISDGTRDSIVEKWVAARDGIGGIHHLAYQVEDVRAVAKEWIANGWGEFAGDVIDCPEDDLVQVFSKPHPLTGVIYEFIKRGEHGFCENSVKALMESTKDNK